MVKKKPKPITLKKFLQDMVKDAKQFNAADYKIGMHNCQGYLDDGWCVDIVVRKHETCPKEKDEEE